MGKLLLLCLFAKTRFEETIQVCAKMSEISGRNVTPPRLFLRFVRGKESYRSVPAMRPYTIFEISAIPS